MASIIRGSALQPRPWPNGLGVTRDITGGLGAADPGWLLSIADLVQDAAFSHFPGCDRVFTLIEGGGVTLTLEDAFAMPCLPFVPASFPGDRPSFCTMGCPSARAFNLFVDRSRCDGRVAVRTIAAHHTLNTTKLTQAVFCVAGTLRVGGETLAPGDTALQTEAATIRTAGTSAVALIVEIETLGTP
jgi:environmental stress-induced protein Ves